MRITISKFSFREHVKKQQYLLLAICANFLSKIEKFKLEVAGVGNLGTGFYFQSSPLTYLKRKLQLTEYHLFLFYI